MLPPDHVPNARNRARYHATRIVRRLALPACDRDDITQDILLAVLMRTRRYDAHRGAWTTFLSLLCAHAAHDCIQAQISRKRIVHVSLDEPARSESRVTLAETMAESVTLWGHADRGAPAVEARHDLLRCLAQRDAQERRIARLLLCHAPVAAADRSGMSRATFYRRRTDLARALVAAGIHP